MMPATSTPALASVNAPATPAGGSGVGVGDGAGVAVGGDTGSDIAARVGVALACDGATVDTGDADGLSVGVAVGVGDAVGVGEELGVGDAVGAGEAVGFRVALGVGVGEVELTGVGVANTRLRQIVRATPSCRRHKAACSCKPARSPRPNVARHPAMLGTVDRGDAPRDMHCSKRAVNALGATSRNTFGAGCNGAATTPVRTCSAIATVNSPTIPKRSKHPTSSRHVRLAYY
jgi:hypothetical protein